MGKKVLTPPQGDLTKQEIIKIVDSLKNVANGIAGLNSAAQLNLAQIPLLPASQLGFGFAWEKVAEIDVSTATSGVSFTGLSGDTDKIYLLTGTVYNTSTVARAFWLRFNADVSAPNYGYIDFRNEAGTTSTYTKAFTSTTGTAAIIVTVAGANAFCHFCCLINAIGITAGTKTYVTVCGYSFGANAVKVDLIGGGWIKQAEVTEIDFVQVAGSYIGAGSKFWLFKPKW